MEEDAQRDREDQFWEELPEQVSFKDLWHTGPAFPRSHDYSRSHLERDESHDKAVEDSGPEERILRFRETARRQANYFQLKTKEFYRRGIEDRRRKKEDSRRKEEDCLRDKELRERQLREEEYQYQQNLECCRLVQRKLDSLRRIQEEMVVKMEVHCRKKKEISTENDDLNLTGFARPSRDYYSDDTAWNNT
jgi:hypothetical protein